MKFVLLLLSLFAVARGADASLRLVRPSRGDIVRYVTLPGSIVANQKVTLYAKVAGHLKVISVDKGDAVKAGQLVAQLEAPELVAERSRRTAEVKIAQAEMDRITAARAKAPDLITPQALDAAEARLSVAKATAAETDTLLQYAQITAPFAGVVTMRYVDLGAFVPAATAGATPAAAAIVTIMDLSTVRAQVPVPEIEASRIRNGQPVRVSVDGIPGQTFKATVSRQSYALDEATRSLLVEADIPNEDLALRPGMYASVRVGVEQHTGALLVPAEALVKEKTATFLWLAVDGKANRVPVKVGFSDGAQVELLDGVPENAVVIVPGKVALTQEQPVPAVEVK